MNCKVLVRFEMLWKGPGKLSFTELLPGFLGGARIISSLPNAEIKVQEASAGTGHNRETTSTGLEEHGGYMLWPGS